MGYVYLEFLRRREIHEGDLRHARPSSLGSYGHRRSSGSPGAVAPLENQWNLRRVCQGQESYGLTHWVRALDVWLHRPRGSDLTPGRNWCSLTMTHADARLRLSLLCESSSRSCGAIPAKKDLRPSGGSLGRSLR
ncbi:hypothetical protein B296_00010980 [Ensete ventricosum]|uniref:Uncharacterized protein n=1 Tax=Ensete ventricosum TaxID=4639 RepID=A0A426Z4I6_ENSVE|nr:hypothetical protein B296_00010980 [Ensete ventricosum]